MQLRVACALFFAALPAFAQDSDDPTVQEGNVVEYFGREKVDDIAEGETLHVFRDGLLLPIGRGGFGFASGATPRDPVMARFLTGSPTGVAEGDAFGATPRGGSLEWKAISVDDKSTFRFPRRQSGVLRVAYESDKQQNALLEVTGPTWVIFNGKPRVGDHYNFGYTLLPVRLRAGMNEVVMKGGRFPEMRVRLVAPATPVLFTKRHLTAPDVLSDEPQELHAAIRVLNTADQTADSYAIVCSSGDRSTSTKVPAIPPLSSIKAPFTLPPVESIEEGAEEVEFQLSLRDAEGAEVATETLSLPVRTSRDKHRRTFVSEIDGSVQYYAVTPPSVDDLKAPAMFLSVHGASVEAINQARAYGHKDWGYLVAPTNRGPFGYAWEDWGRLDAMEVLAHAEGLFGTDRERTYLTGHSMGGHGSWYLGATYPDRFAAVAPCAGYPDLLAYRDGFRDRLRTMSREQREQFGITDEMLERLMSEPTPTPMERMMLRAGNPSRTLKFLDNHKQHGLYILHGEVDTVVPTAIARDARRRVGEFHNDFTYYEYPNGTHWYGDESVDWPPIFDMFRARRVPDSAEIDAFTFATASPGVSAASHGVTITQQIKPLELSRFEFERKEGAVSIATENIATLTIDAEQVGLLADEPLTIDETEIEVTDVSASIHLVRNESDWSLAEAAPPKTEKGPHRNGGFKDAFRNRVVLVYGTGGAASAADWAFTKARFDAEKFGYRANARVQVVPDTAFDPADYPDRNVILYGNRDVNSAWSRLLPDCPLQFAEGKVAFGDVRLSGPGWGAYYVYPRPDSEIATVGVVAATGPEGRKAASANHYLVNGNGFPDVTLFDGNLLEYGSQALKCAGFFGADWSVESGDFEWR